MAQKSVIPLLYIALTFAMLSKINTFSLPMIPIDSSQLQLFPQRLSTEQRLELLMNITMARGSLYSRRSARKLSNSNASLNSIESSVDSMASNFYATQLFFGTSNDLLSAYVLLDSGSDVTWVQCEGCNPCFEMKGGSIEILKSITFKFLTKDDPRCIPKKVIHHYWCGYDITYGGGASTSGTVGSDTFYFLNSTTRSPEFFKDIVFGCGLHNEHIDFGANSGPDNPIAGIFGLSPGPKSFLNQLDEAIKGRFSYCLPSWTEPNQGISTLHYGDGAEIGTGNDVRSIKMNSDGLYHLHFRGISIEGRRLETIDESTCPLNGDELKGFTIDSGAPCSLLPRSAYRPLRNAIAGFLDRYGWQRARQQYFDLCYTVPSGQNMDDRHFPEVVFHFENGDGSGSEVDWVMARDNMFAKFDSIRGFCMTVAEYQGVDDTCLFGAYQHANFKVLFDVRNSILLFRPQRCQENT